MWNFNDPHTQKVGTSRENSRETQQVDSLLENTGISFDSAYESYFALGV